MSQPEQKIIQYLNEAHASEVALTRVLQSQIAMTPRGSYRSGLEKHLRETRDHAQRTRDRLRELGAGGNPIQAVTGIAQSVVGQTLAFGKTPFDMVRGTGGEEKVLKNAKDACASEALEIATYTAIETLADEVGDKDTAKLARQIRREEEKMARFLEKQIPQLTKAVVREEIPSSERQTGRRRSSSRSSSASSSSRSSSSRSAGSSRGGSKSRSGSSSRGGSSRRSS